MLVLSVGLVLAATAFVACGGGSSSPSATPVATGRDARDPELAAGRRLFAEYCSACHGQSGEGGIGPRFTDGRLLRDFPTIEDQVGFVSRGKGAMPAWGRTMSPSEIHAVVRYEREVLSTRRK